MLGLLNSLIESDRHLFIGNQLSLKIYLFAAYILYLLARFVIKIKWKELESEYS